MTMLRKAILIGSDSASPSNPLPGATKDNEDLYAFLQTAAGGAWFEEEIAWYPIPDLRELRSVLEEAKATHDYLFVTTMLHGARGPTGSLVSLNETEAIRIAEIASPGPRAKRVLILSGGCRLEIPSIYAPPQKRVAGTGDVAGVPSAAYMRNCRAAFEDLVMRAPPGHAVMFACSPNEESWYIAGRGGVFTQALLRKAEEWSSSISDGERVRRYYTAEKALDAVRETTTALVRRLGYTQTPQIWPVEAPAFPFMLA
jgi:hypothetical protein